MKVFYGTFVEGFNEDLLPGVVAVNNLGDWFWDEVYNNGLNLDEWRWYNDFAERSDGEPVPDDYPMIDEPTWLVGDWRLDGDKWEAFAGTNGYSAILQWMGGAAILTVVRSDHWTSVTSMCSPCCPGQANLDSGYDERGYTCYSLPAEFYLSKEE
jgi:hypothetical protein